MIIVLNYEERQMRYIQQRRLKCSLISSMTLFEIILIIASLSLSISNGYFYSNAYMLPNHYILTSSHCNKYRFIHPIPTRAMTTITTSSTRTKRRMISGKKMEYYSSVMALSANNNNDNESSNNNDKNETTTSINNDITNDQITSNNQTITTIMENDNSWIQQIFNQTPPRLTFLIRLLFSRLTKILPNIKTSVISFTAGIILTLTIVLVPIHDIIEKTSEPVALFETILTDLDKGYVDEVDTRKLFETGMSAMLGSLDPYTEFESRTEAEELNESVSGRYGGVGLVISGAQSTPPPVPVTPKISETGVGGVSSPSEKVLPQNAIDDSIMLDNDNDKNNLNNNIDIDLDIDDDAMEDAAIDDSIRDKLERRKALKRARTKGIRVVTAFEGYAFDYGMRPGDKIIAIDDHRLLSNEGVEDVRSRLRGQPGSSVAVTFLREGVKGENTIVLPRSVVRIPDVKLATLVGPRTDGMGYIRLGGFTSDAGRETRNAILSLKKEAEEASGGERTLKGLILDLRGNPGGLLTSSVDVASLLVPKDSDIVSARGRGFPSVLYRSRVDPIINPVETRLAVLIDGGTASAAEIVSGAVQDLDVGVIVGGGRTFGKGLVQNVEQLPFNTALKFTVAKYYTPSGRCIQSTKYTAGGPSSNKNNDDTSSSKDGNNNNNNSNGKKYKAEKVSEKDKETFLTKNGREVKDGGGVESDYKIKALKASALEIALVRSGVITEYASEWSRNHVLTDNFSVDDNTYKDFQKFVKQRQIDNEDESLQNLLFGAPIEQLRRGLKVGGYSSTERELDQLKSNLIREMDKDFTKYGADIKEDIGQGILARYLPESMLLERNIRTDIQVTETVKLLKSNDGGFDKLLSRVDNGSGSGGGNSGNKDRMALSQTMSSTMESEGKTKVIKMKF